MSALFILIPISMLLLFFAVVAFVWSVNHDQMEDLDKAGEQILFDDDLEKGDATASSSDDERSGES